MTISIKPTASGSTIEQDGSTILTVDGSGNLSTPNTFTSTGAITGTGGIYLGGTSAANLLDDYEEGTWTPVWNATSGSMSYTKQSGLYTKVGSLVVATCHIITSANNSFSGGVYLTGLPFIAESSGTVYTACPMHVENVNLAASTWIWGHVNPGQAQVNIRYWINNAPAGSMVGTQMNSNSDIMVTCSYKTSV